MKLWAVELSLFISSLIFSASLIAIDFMNLGDRNMAAADAWKLFLVIDDITFFREGVQIAYE